MKPVEQNKKEAGVDVVTDSAIEIGLKDAFGKDSGLKVHGLDLKVRHGEVTIDGKVADATQRARASAIAEKVKGVKALDNKIMVGTVDKATDKSSEKPAEIGKIAPVAPVGKTHDASPAKA
jgi:osmotically-inducible protein OsmY